MAKPINLDVAILMVPLPAQGHLNQLLHLTRLISAYNLPLHFAGTAVHLRQAKIRVQGWDSLSISNIKFHEFPTPSYESPPPNPNSSNKFPTQLMPSFNATFHLRQPVSSLLHELSMNYRRVIVIYDSLMAWVLQDAPSTTNVECYSFRSLSVFTIYCWNKSPRQDLKNLPSMADCVTPEFLEYSKIQKEHREIISSGDLFNSSYEIEGEFLDLLLKENNSSDFKHWAVGPLNPVKLSKDSRKPHKTLDWLDEQEPNSVIFVSFGTTTSLSDEEIKELAIGLEKSEQKFIWVLRDADKGDIFTGESRKAELPEGYEERVKNRGLIVRDWAPQLEILGHVSTGGFMSHCGWNSCMESISMGVPIVAWPMHTDQPTNAVLITDVLKIGVMLKKWGVKDEIVSSVEIEKCVKKLMDSEEGNEMRKRAMEFSKAVVDGGGSGKEMDSFVAHITR